MPTVGWRNEKTQLSSINYSLADHEGENRGTEGKGPGSSYGKASGGGPLKVGGVFVKKSQCTERRGVAYLTLGGKGIRRRTASSPSTGGYDEVNKAPFRARQTFKWRGPGLTFFQYTGEK